jgi:hypothetical protein
MFSKPRYDLKEIKRPVWGSAGGLYKRFRPPVARPQAPPPVELYNHKADIFVLASQG